MFNVSTIYKNVFHCLKNIRKNTLRFGSNLLPSSGENTNPKREFTKNVKTHIKIIRTQESTPKNINSKWAPIIF
jgi:hypothetical protein